MKKIILAAIVSLVSFNAFAIKGGECPAGTITAFYGELSNGSGEQRLCYVPAKKEWRLGIRDRGEMTFDNFNIVGVEEFNFDSSDHKETAKGYRFKPDEKNQVIVSVNYKDGKLDSAFVNVNNEVTMDFVIESVRYNSVK